MHAIMNAFTVTIIVYMGACGLSTVSSFLSASLSHTLTYEEERLNQKMKIQAAYYYYYYDETPSSWPVDPF